MNNTRLIYAIFSVIVGVLLLGIWSNIQVYAQQPPVTATNSPSITTISLELKAKMCDPSNPSLKVVNTTEARLCGIPKTVKPPIASAATPPTSAVTSPPPQPTTTTKSTTVATNTATPPKQQQVKTSNNNTNAISRSTNSVAGTTIAPVSHPTTNAPSTIAPQVNGINNQQQLLIASNSSAVQNYTFASTSPLPGSGKLMFLGFHADSTSSTDSALTGKTSTGDKSHGSDSNHGTSSDNKKSSSSDNKKSSSSDNKKSSSSDNKKSSSSDNKKSSSSDNKKSSSDNNSSSHSSHNSKSSSSSSSSSS
jgi:hypothetical protein